MTEKEFLEHILIHLTEARRLAANDDFDRMAIKMTEVCGNIVGRIGALKNETPKEIPWIHQNNT